MPAAPSEAARTVGPLPERTDLIARKKKVVLVGRVGRSRGDFTPKVRIRKESSSSTIVFSIGQLHFNLRTGE